MAIGQGSVDPIGRHDADEVQSRCMARTGDWKIKESDMRR